MIQLDIPDEEVMDRNGLLDIIKDPLCAHLDSFRITGSLLDYRIEEHATILSCNEYDGDIACNIDCDWPDEFEKDDIAQEESRLQDSAIRAGIISHVNLQDVMERVRMQDDVIIGIDTNVLWDCLMTSVLMDEIYAEDFPNWVLVAVPKVVMAETENAANNTFGGSHPRVGDPVYKGRVGQRALQEIMEVQHEDPERPGIAMITIGDMSSNADISRGNWELDSLIRNQFQKFLGDISFHKGTFFISQDRVNVMMSESEGADGLYLQKPDIESFRTQTLTPIEFTKFLYELCIQFGSISVVDDESDETIMDLTVLWPGKQVKDWENSRLTVSGGQVS
jgi:hypothetical protein